MLAPARRAAWRALSGIAEGHVDLPAACAAQDAALPDARDRALLREIVTGTERWRRTLDHVLVHHAQRDASRIDPGVLTVLELSAYQLLHLTRVPASAVVNDAVSLTRLAGKSSAAGFVNAVLRALSRARGTLPLPEAPAGDAGVEAWAGYLGVAWSHPDWLVQRWLARMGPARTEAWLRFNMQAPPACLRLSTLGGTRDQALAALASHGVVTHAAPFAADGLIVDEGDPAPAVADGWVLHQDEASQLVASLVDAAPGARVLDLCAAPGGKTVAIANRMANTGEIVACDVRPRRVRLLQETLRRAGVTCATARLVVAEGPLDMDGDFDWVLVDAPCSGLGTLRRDPDVKWRRTADDFRRLTATQASLLDRASAVVRPGGRLVYATCSSEPEENEAIIHAFLAAHPAFRLVDLRTHRPATLPVAVVDEDGCLRTAPDRHGLEAFFGAVLVRA